MHSSRWAGIGLLLGCLSPLPAPAGVNAWTTAGPEGGFTNTVTPSPQTRDLVIAATLAGIHKSTDGGLTWRPNSGTPLLPGNVAINPVVDFQMCAAANVVFCSAVAGDAFSQLPAGMQPVVAGAKETWYSADGAFIYVSTAFARIYRSAATGPGYAWTEVTGAWPVGADTLTTFAADPNASGTLYVAVTGSGIYKSVDAGVTWAPTGQGPGSGTFRVNEIAVQPGDPLRVAAATNDALWFSIDGGANWTEPYLSGSFSVAFDPDAPNRVLAIGVDNSVQVSVDGGQNFATLSTQLRNVFQPRRLRFGANPNRRLYVATGDGPMVSVDGGLTFARASSGIRAGTVQALTASDSGAVYAVFGPGPSGVFRGTAGNNWAPVNNANLYAQFLPNPIIFEVAVAPQDGNFLYVVAQNDRIVKSTDGGNTWTFAGAPLLNGLRQFRHVAIDPTNVNVAYAGSLTDGVYRTDDGGGNWVRRSTGLPNGVTALAITRADPRIVYAGATHDGTTSVFKSIDSGLTWSPTGALPATAALDIAVHPTDSRIVYAALPNGLYKSSDAGASWALADSSGTGPGARSVHIDPRVPSTIIATYTGINSGFVRSVDAGATWVRFDLPTAMNPPVGLTTGVVDPANPGRVIVGGQGTALLEYEVRPEMRLMSFDLASSVPTGGTINATLSVRNWVGAVSSPARVQLTLPAWLSAGTLPSGCSVAASVVTCAVPAMEQSTPAFGIVVPLTASATASGPSEVRAQLLAHEGGTDTLVHNVQSTGGNGGTGGGSGGSGGGGSLDWLLLAMLGGLAFAERFVARPGAHGHFASATGATG